MKQDSKHYQGEIETISYMEDKLTKDQMDGYLIGNIIKYSSRLGKKEGQLEKDKFKILDYSCRLSTGKWFHEFLEEVKTNEKV